VSAPARALAPAAPEIVRVRRPAPPDLDPIAFLRVLPDPSRFLWQRPASGDAIAAVGATAAVRAADERRLDAVADGARAFGPGTLLVGGFAFDPAHRPDGPWDGFPAAEWVVPRLALVRRRHRAHLVATAAGGSARELGAWLDRVAERLVARAEPVASAPAVPERYRVGGLDAPRDWQRRVEEALAAIAAGRLAKCVLARAVTLAAARPLDALAVAARLARSAPTATVFAIGRGRATFVGASPERLARVAGDGVWAEALAGTAARGDGPAADRDLGRALGASPKERAEHALVVDDLAARLRPLCRRLAIAAGPRVLRAEAVQHLRTRIAGRLRTGRGLLDVVAALHPTPAVCGTPRREALALVRATEPVPRGWYAGGVGWTQDGGGEIAVAIRAALVGGRSALLHAGAGIVAGSCWEAELEETRLKMRPLLAALLEP
jgi:menaquinone-specific isochorismate synthase